MNYLLNVQGEAYDIFLCHPDLPFYEYIDCYYFNQFDGLKVCESCRKEHYTDKLGSVPFAHKGWAT